MNATLARRTQGAGTRRPVKRGTKSPVVEPSTLGASPSLAPFRALLERFVRAGGSDMHRLRLEVVEDIRRSRYPGRCANELIDECIHRGGPDGLVKAVEVLAKVDPSVVAHEANRFFRRELTRWRRVRNAATMRYTFSDEACHIFLRSVCQTAEFGSAFSFVRIALILGPDSIREGIAAAISDLGDKWPEKKPMLARLVRRVVSGTHPLLAAELSRSSKNALSDALADLGV